MIIRTLQQSDEQNLAEFLRSLGAETRRLWNRFGDYGTVHADEIARAQAGKPATEEIGYIIEDNKIIGYGFLRFFPDKPQKKTTCTLGIAIADRWQGKGLGKKLMQFIIDDAKVRGMKKVWLGTYTTNEAGLRLYKSCGFQVEGVFMADEFFDGLPAHTVSLALFLDGTGNAIKNERKNIIKNLEKS